MLRAVLAVALVAASGAAASAGSYIGLGVGTAASISDSADNMDIPAQGSGRSWRLLGGLRFGRLSLEAEGGRYSMFLTQSAAPYDSTQIAALLKYSFPLGDNFELFGRGGLQRTWLTTSRSGAEDASGNGYVLGAGFEYRLNAIVAGGSVFVDYERSSAQLTSDRTMTPVDTTAGMWTLGFTLGI